MKTLLSLLVLIAGAFCTKAQVAGATRPVSVIDHGKPAADMHTGPAEAPRIADGMVSTDKLARDLASAKIVEANGVAPRGLASGTILSPNNRPYTSDTLCLIALRPEPWNLRLVPVKPVP